MRVTNPIEIMPLFQAVSPVKSPQSGICIVKLRYYIHRGHNNMVACDQQ
jgi:hypothetical protein